MRQPHANPGHGIVLQTREAERSPEAPSGTDTILRLTDLNKHYTRPARGGGGVVGGTHSLASISSFNFLGRSVPHQNYGN